MAQLAEKKASYVKNYSDVRLQKKEQKIENDKNSQELSSNLFREKKVKRMRSDVSSKTLTQVHLMLILQSRINKKHSDTSVCNK